MTAELRGQLGHVIGTRNSDRSLARTSQSPVENQRMFLKHEARAALTHASWVHGGGQPPSGTVPPEHHLQTSQKMCCLHFWH